MTTDTPETAGDLPDGATVRYFGQKRCVHIEAMDCNTQIPADRTAGTRKPAGVLFDSRPICRDCREEYRDGGHAGTAESDSKGRDGPSGESHDTPKGEADGSTS